MGPCRDSSPPSILAAARNERLVCAHLEQWEDFNQFKMISRSRSFCLLKAYFLPLPALRGGERFGGTILNAMTGGRGTCVLPSTRSVPQSRTMFPRLPRRVSPLAGPAASTGHGDVPARGLCSQPCTEWSSPEGSTPSTGHGEVPRACGQENRA